MPRFLFGELREVIGHRSLTFAKLCERAFLIGLFGVGLKGRFERPPHALERVALLSDRKSRLGFLESRFVSIARFSMAKSGAIMWSRGAGFFSKDGLGTLKGDQSPVLWCAFTRKAGSGIHTPRLAGNQYVPDAAHLPKRAANLQKVSMRDL